MRGGALPRDAAYVLTAERCQQFATARRVILEFYARNGVTLPGLAEELDAMAAVAAERDPRRVRNIAGSDRGSDRFGDSTDLQTAGDDVWVNVRTASELLKISDTAVRKARAKGYLRGRQCGGPGTSWQIEHASLEQFAKERSDRRK